MIQVIAVISFIVAVLTLAVSFFQSSVAIVVWAFVVFAESGLIVIACFDLIDREESYGCH